jgi:ClpP class serine protease
MSTARIKLFTSLEQSLKSRVILYATSDRRHMEANISSDILPIFVNHLDTIGDVEKISLILYTRGGDTLAAWSLVNLIRNFCKNFEIIVPFHCHSAGTLICLGADRIIMTKQATLGPIDPSVNGPMNPVVVINGQQRQIPVSVEFINGYIEMARTELGINDQIALAQILDNLSNKVNPMVLGQVQRTRAQIQMLAKKLLAHQNIDETKHNDIINFLCKESGSHDYTIYRREAKEELGLNIEKPDNNLYSIINGIYEDIKTEMELDIPFEPQLLLAGNTQYQYSCHRVIIESISTGEDSYISEGQLTKQVVQPQIQGGFSSGIIQPNFLPQTIIQDNRIFEGWRHI